jgi:hypothetical protein
MNRLQNLFFIFTRFTFSITYINLSRKNIYPIKKSATSADFYFDFDFGKSLIIATDQVLL